jgi:hypothetical protein
LKSAVKDFLLLQKLRTLLLEKRKELPFEYPCDQIGIGEAQPPATERVRTVIANP